MVTVKDRISGLLRAERGAAVCGGCLSAGLQLDRYVAALALEALGNSWEFEVANSACSKCGQTLVVFRALPRQYLPG